MIQAQQRAIEEEIEKHPTKHSVGDGSSKSSCNAECVVGGCNVSCGVASRCYCDEYARPQCECVTSKEVEEEVKKVL